MQKFKSNSHPGRVYSGIILSIFLIFFLSTTIAQRYPFTTITNKDGLPQSSVFKTVQDHQGYMWMATEAGLSRFDGYQFRNYSYFSGLNANFIFDIEIDPKGRLWCGAFGTGIAVFNGEDFYCFNNSNGFPVNFVHDLLFTTNNELWIASKDYGVMRFTLNYSPRMFQYPKTGVEFYANELTELPNGDILAAGDKGIFRFEKTNGFQPVLIYKGYTYTVFPDNTGGLWVGGEGEIKYLKGDSIIDKSYLMPYPVGITNIVEPTGDGTLYFTTENGLLIVNGEETTWLTSANGLSYDLTKDVLLDDFGNLWVSTYGNGATILNDRGMTHYDVDNEGGDLCAFSIGEEKNGTIWIGKYFGGFFEITDTSFGRSDQDLPHDANPLMSFSDVDGNVYLNSSQTHIYKISDGKLVWKFRNPFPGKVMYGLMKLKDGRILSTGSFGCMVIDEKTNEYSIIESTKDIFMKDPFYDEYGNLWLIGELGEIYKIDNNDRVIEYTHLLNPGKTSVTHGMYDRIRHAWWFTSATGVIIWDGKNQLRLHSGNVLTADLCFSVTMDKNNNIWIGQVQGLAFIDMVERSVTQLGYDQGFTPVETNSAAAFTDSKGNVWFGTLTSATKVDVNKIGKDTTRGILRLQEIEVNGKLWYKENYNDTAYPKIQVKHNQNNFDFQFVSLCYTNPNDVQYSWKMEGVDDDWITKVNTREVNYSNLGPGEYTFKIKAKNPNGYLTNQIDIQIEIAKPFWKTAGFYFFEALMFLFIVFLSFRFTRQSSNNRLGQIMTLLSIFIIFESVMLYISGYIDKFTSGIPVFQLIMNVILAASLHPLEQRIQKFMKRWARKGKKLQP